MIISFSWTTPALLAGAKTVTRRDWKDVTANLALRHFHHQKSIEAYDKSPRLGGKRVAWIRLTERPVKESTATIPPGDFTCEGFGYFKHAARVGPRDLDRETQAERAERIWREWQVNPRDLWVVRFEVVTIEPRAVRP